MDELKEKISNIDSLNVAVKEKNGSFKEGIKEYYQSLGEELGFNTCTDSPAITGGIEYGHFDIVFCEADIAFSMEFSDYRNLLEKAFSHIMLKPALSVFLLSSRSMCKPDFARELLCRCLQNEFLIVDVSAK
jgi:hypothetical protein